MCNICRGTHKLRMKKCGTVMLDIIRLFHRKLTGNDSVITKLYRRVAPMPIYCRASNNNQAPEGHISKLNMNRYTDLAHAAGGWPLQRIVPLARHSAQCAAGSLIPQKQVAATEIKKTDMQWLISEGPICTLSYLEIRRWARSCCADSFRAPLTCSVLFCGHTSTYGQIFCCSQAYITFCVKTRQHQEYIPLPLHNVFVSIVLYVNVLVERFRLHAYA